MEVEEVILIGIHLTYLQYLNPGSNWLARLTGARETRTGRGMDTASGRDWKKQVALSCKWIQPKIGSRKKNCWDKVNDRRIIHRLHPMSAEWSIVWLLHTPVCLKCGKGPLYLCVCMLSQSGWSSSITVSWLARFVCSGYVFEVH